MRRTGAVLVTLLATAGCLTVATAAAADPPSSTVALVRAIALPTGGTIHARIDGGRWTVVAEPGDTHVAVSRIGGHVYALPLAALADGQSLASFDLPVLAARQYADVPKPRPASVTPYFPQVTATVRVALPADPVPFQVVVTLVNTDDARRYGQTLLLTDAHQRLSLPTGHYSVIVYSVARDPATHHFVQRMAFAVDQVVQHDGDVIRADLRAATQSGYPTYRTSTPTEVVDRFENYAVTDGSGRNTGGVWIIEDNPRVELYAAAAGPARYGRLVSTNSTEGNGPDGTYRYLSWGHPDRVVPAEQVNVPSGQLTTVTRSYYTDGATHEGIAGRAPIYPYFDPGFQALYPIPLPLRRIEEVFSPPGVVWFSSAQASADGGGFAELDGFAAYRPGASIDEDLWRGPLAPGVLTLPREAQTYPYGGPRTCAVCRTASGMVVGLSPVVGSQPDYGGGLFAGPGQRPTEVRLAVYRDGERVYSGTNVQGGSVLIEPAQVSVPAETHAYRIVQTTNRAVDGMSLSTLATTDYRFPSSATSGAPLARSWNCVAPGPRPCTVLPLLSVRMPLPTSLTGTLPDGFSFVAASVGHIQGATATPITGLRVWIRSGGDAWASQQVSSLGGGRYYLAIRNTAAAGSPVDVRWRASDAAGSTVTQTVAAAYTIAGS